MKLVRIVWLCSAVKLVHLFAVAVFSQSKVLPNDAQKCCNLELLYLILLLLSTHSAEIMFLDVSIMNECVAVYK